MFFIDDKGNCPAKLKTLRDLKKPSSAEKMKKSSCEIVRQIFPKVFQFADLRLTYIGNCGVNIFLSFTAIMLNIATIHAIRKTSSLPNTLKTLLLSLAVSDVGVGLLGQPFYASLLVKWLQQNDPGCMIYMSFIFIVNVFSFASFLGVVAISVDRFLAIHLHLRYQELVTHKRVVAVVISIWLLSVFHRIPMFWIPPDVYSRIYLISGVIGLFLTTVAYIRIYVAVQLHRNQIHSLQIQEGAENGEMANFARIIKSAVGTFYVYVVFLICYLPFFISLVVYNINGPSIEFKRSLLSSFTVMYFNSSLNPVLYCWKMRHIRHAIMDILRNISCLGNRAVH